VADDKLDQILSRVKTLPTLPTIVYRLLKLIESPASTATELSEVISKDQGLTARILRLVNSSFYALRSPVVKVSHAISLLGFVAIKNLALGLSVVDMFDHDQDSSELDGNAIWEHSLCCATCARLIAERVRYTPAEEAFVAGLLHDIGKVVLQKHFRRQFQAAVRAARDEMIPLPQAERFLFENDHPEIGAALAEHWRLPAQLRAPIGGHHAFREGEPLTNIIYVANALSKLKQIGSGGNTLLQPVEDRAWEAVGLDERGVIRLMSKVRREVDRAKTCLDLTGAVPKRDMGEIGTTDIRVAESGTKRLLILEEHRPAISLVELLLLDHGHTTYRTTYPHDEAAAMADLVILDFSEASLEHAHRLCAELEERLQHRVPVVLLPAPRRVSDVLEAVHVVFAEAGV
jgi:putative nucleotidyltransferase with HDIG domain